MELNEEDVSKPTGEFRDWWVDVRLKIYSNCDREIIERALLGVSFTPLTHIFEFGNPKNPVVVAQVTQLNHRPFSRKSEPVRRDVDRLIEQIMEYWDD